MATLTATGARERVAGVLERPAARRAVRAAQVIGFALLTCAGAKIRVPLPFTPVPGTLQTLPVLLAGALLGARAGALSQALYLALGIAGLPVFALPGSGPAYLLGPTGGFLLGFVAAAYVTGRVVRVTRDFGWPGIVVALLCGSAALYLCGLSWLTFLLGGDVGSALHAGLAPFLLFDLAKVMVGTGVVRACARIGLKRTGGCASGSRS